MYLVRAASRSNDLLIQNTIDVLLNAAVIEAFACAMESNGKKYIRKVLPCRPGPIVSLPDKTFYSLTQELPMVVGLHRICGAK